jgi:hypothetical protein
MILRVAQTNYRQRLISMVLRVAQTNYRQRLISMILRVAQTNYRQRLISMILRSIRISIKAVGTSSLHNVVECPVRGGQIIKR